MIRTRTFEWDVEGNGWRLTDAAPGWYSGSGFLAAHDLVEHLSNKADWAHELRATGVSAYTLPGVRHRDNQSIAEDLVGFAVKDHHFRVPVAPLRWAKPLRSKLHEGRVQRLAEAIQDKVVRGMRRAEETGLPVPADVMENAPLFVARVTPWLRRGYAAAQRVYGKDRNREVGELIDKVKDAIDIDHDKLPPITGDTLVVSVDTDALTFTVTRKGNEKLSAKRRERIAVAERMDAGLRELFPGVVLF